MPKAARPPRRRRPRPPATSTRALAAPRSSAASPRIATIEQRLARLLETPHLATLVPGLAPETLHLVIQHRGLDACGELIAAATPEQLTAVLDLDLWHPPRSGGDDRLDEDRFRDWLEMLQEAGEMAAARIIGSIDASLVIAGLSRYIRVIDAAALVPSVDLDECPDVESDPFSGPTHEMAGYVVRARRTDAWDAIRSMLGALEDADPTRFHDVMEGCRRLSDEGREIDGLDELLEQPEQLLHDVGAARDERRSAQGYATAADARAFLQMARRRPTAAPAAPRSTNPLAAAYFRAADTARQVPAERAAADPEWVDAVVRLLGDAGGQPAAGRPATGPRALLGGAVSDPAPRTPIQTLLESVADQDEARLAMRAGELAFLANTLVAGCSIRSRAITPREASNAVMATCSLGLEYWPGPATPRAEPGAERRVDLPVDFLVNHDLVTVFEVGWSVLHREVSLFVAKQLEATLSHLQCADRDIQAGLVTLRRELATHCDAGTPWQARDALDAISMLDLPVWASLQGLLDECPVLPAVLTATMTGGTGRVSATAFEFIATRRQVHEVHQFGGKLLDLLMR